MVVIRAEELVKLAAGLLERAGASGRAAGECAEVLVEADLQGLGSHGIMRLPIYLSAIDRGQIDPAGQPVVERTGPATATVDGANTLGPVVSLAAMRTALDLAREAGTGMVTARRSNHYGAAAYYVEMAARSGMIGLSATNSPPAIPAWGGREALLGTNPLALGFPTSGDPLVVDLSLSVVARGKIIQAARAGQPIPAGWAVDSQGRETTDPQAALAGALLPLGGAKGFALALAIEILTGVLSGAAASPQVTSILEQDTQPANVGHWFAAMDITRFVSPQFYHTQLDGLLQAIKNSAPVEGMPAIRLPGQQRAAARRRHLAEGVNLPPETVSALRQWAGRYNLEGFDDLWQPETPAR